VVVVGLGLAGLLAAVAFLPVSDCLAALLAAAEEAGPLGAFVYAVVYGIAVTAMIPGSVLTLGAGLLYGPFGGLAVVWPGAMLGAVLSFVLGRNLLRDQVEARVAQNPTFGAIDRAMGDDGLTLVGLLRLSPVFPFNLLNYGLGLTSISLRDYTLATGVGILPGTFLYVYLGSTLSSIGQIFDGTAPSSPGQQVLQVGGLLATIAVTVLATRRARAALAERIDDPSDALESSP
jgi:uncharacterized membrane protein YdjX (TVP38/TMEM64 family)